MATFSVTDRATFRRCRRRWDWSSNTRQNLTGIGAGAEPLELGGLIHRALADWISIWSDTPKIAESENTLSSLFMVHASQRQTEITNAYIERTGQDEIPKVHLEALHNVVNLGTDMMRNYQDYHKSPLPKHMSFASSEQEVIIPVPGTAHRCIRCVGTGCIDCNGTGIKYHHLSATLDGLLQDNKDRFLVLEHKTYENRPKPMDLYMNDQFTGYCWVVRELGIGKVAGICYDGMWKRSKPPNYMQKEKRKGVPDDLFIRKIISKEDAELDQWGANLAKEINEMANNPPIYPNVPWQGCSDCNFQEPCYTMMRGEDPTRLIQLQYTQREVVRSGLK